jgi:hypothetical protein
MANCPTPPVHGQAPIVAYLSMVSPPPPPLHGQPNATGRSCQTTRRRSAVHAQPPAAVWDQGARQKYRTGRLAAAVMLGLELCKHGREKVSETSWIPVRCYGLSNILSYCICPYFNIFSPSLPLSLVKHNIKRHDKDASFLPSTRVFFFLLREISSIFHSTLSCEICSYVPMYQFFIYGFVFWINMPMH